MSLWTCRTCGGLHGPNQYGYNTCPKCGCMLDRAEVGAFTPFAGLPEKDQPSNLPYRAAPDADSAEAIHHGVAEILRAGFRAGERHTERPMCDCGRPLTRCSSCVEEEYQAAHPECPTCCPPRPRTTEERERDKQMMATVGSLLTPYQQIRGAIPMDDTDEAFQEALAMLRQAPYINIERGVLLAQIEALHDDWCNKTQGVSPNCNCNGINYQSVIRALSRCGV